MKKRVLKQVNIDTDVFLTSLDKAATLLLEVKEELEKKGWSSVHLALNQNYDYSDLVVMGMCEETDKEYQDRLKKDEQKRLADEKAKARNIEKERKQYEKLKKKFQSKIN